MPLLNETLKYIQLCLCDNFDFSLYSTYNEKFPNLSAECIIRWIAQYKRKDENLNLE